MTVEELSQLFFLRKEVDLYRRNLSEVDHRIAATPYKRVKEPLRELRDIIATELKRRTLERDELAGYINAIDDDFTKRLFVMRFVDGLTFAQISIKLGGYVGEDALKKQVYRYMKRHPE